MAARESIARLWPRIQVPPVWGIEPVPREHRILGFLDYLVLWGDLGVSLLLLVAGALLVPGLGLGPALLAILIGALVGNLLLALAGVVGSDNAVPTMVLLRPVLGLRGSYLPTVLNLIQLIGWGAFEVMIMAQAAHAASQALFGASNYPLWVAIFAVLCTLMAVAGPLIVVRQWMEKFAVWVVLIITLWLTYYFFVVYDAPSLLRQPGTGEMPFWLAVDLVIAMPISWMPLVADYSRFARRSDRAFWGTYLGYFLANVWFYGLGAMLVLALKTTPGDLITALATAVTALAAGWMVLLILLVQETDEAFADIYSAAVSAQNLWPRAPQRWLAVAAGALCFLLAATLDLAKYEEFLFLIGSFFVPLFGLLAADYFVLRGRRYEGAELYRPQGRYWYWGGINGRAILAWALGFAVYWLIKSNAPWLGASLPSFLAAFVLHLVLARVGVRPAREAA